MPGCKSRVNRACKSTGRTLEASSGLAMEDRQCTTALTLQNFTAKSAYILRELAVHRPALCCKLGNGRSGNLLRYKASGDPARD